MKAMEFDTEQMMKTFGSRLKELRNKKHLKQDEIAHIFGVAPSTIGAYERGSRQTTLDTICKMSQFFNVSVDYLLGLTNDERTVENFKKEDSKELKDFLKDQAIMFNGLELSENDKQRVMDILSGMFWQRFTNLNK